MKRINSIVLHIKILLALAVFFSANAFSNPNDKFLKLAKENYINGEYAEGDFHIADILGIQMPMQTMCLKSSNIKTLNQPPF